MPRAEPGFTVASFNIHYAIGGDRRFDPMRIARAVTAFDADIVALQEVGWHYRGRAGIDQFDFLREQTGYEAHAGLTRSHARAHFGNALLTRVPVPTVRRFDLSVRLRAPRGGIDAEVEIAGRRVRVINVHLGLDPWERRIQAGRLLDAIRAQPGGPLVLLGDFNDWRAESAGMRELRSLLPHCLSPRSYPSRRPMLRFDRVYASAELTIEEGGVFDPATTRRASDHLPVVARIGFAG